MFRREQILRHRERKIPINLFGVFSGPILVCIGIWLFYFLSKAEIPNKLDCVFRNHCIISIIIPLYNKEKYIKRALKSAMSQNVTNLDVLVIDDGSKDDGPNIVLKYARKDRRIRMIRLPRNRGTHFVRIFGVMNAYGEYIMSLDPDDELFPSATWVAKRTIEEKQPDIVELKIMQYKKLRVKKNRRRKKLKLVAYGYAKPRNEYMNQQMLIRDYIGLNFNWNLPRKCIKATVYSKALSLLSTEEANARIIFAEDKLQVGLIVLTAESLVYVKEPGYIYHTYLTDNSRALAKSERKDDYINKDLVYVNKVLTRVFRQAKGIIYDPKGH